MSENDIPESSTQFQPVIIFETNDPLGRIVSLSQATWDEHIVPHHPEMAGEQKKLKKSIEKPDYITRDSTFAETQNYYYTHNSIRLPAKYIQVCVDFGSGGTVKTAYTVNDVDNTETIIYRK